jgi:hypothetical protein
MTTDVQSYLATVDARLREGGYAVEMHAIGGMPTLTGYRSEFRWSWMATKLHLFVCVRSVPVVTQAALEDFARASSQYAKDTKGALRGFQSGTAVIAVLVGGSVEPDAAAYADKKLVQHWAAVAWPVAVDLGAGRRFSQKGRPKLGGIYTSWLKKQIDLALPAAR